MIRVILLRLVLGVRKLGNLVVIQDGSIPDIGGLPTLFAGGIPGSLDEEGSRFPENGACEYAFRSGQVTRGIRLASLLLRIALHS